MKMGARKLFASSLTKRILEFSALTITLTFWAVMWRSEVVLEGAFLDQTKREALVFLLGIEHEIGKLDEPLNRKALQQVIDQTLQRDQLDLLNFSIYALYIFNADGQILAHSKPGKYPLKQIDDTKAAVFQQGKISLGEEVEYARDPVTGIEIPKAGIIIPLHHNGKVIAAVEVEINLEATIKRIQQFDDRYERELVTVFAICFIILLLFLWWEIHWLLIHPIQSLGAVTEKIAAGELSSREEQLGRDELGDLGRSVNRMADSIEQLFTEQEEAYLQMLQSLAKALEAKDAYTAIHSGRVSKFSVQLGRRLGLDKDELKLLKQVALMHDLGKIGIAEQILNKPAPLDDAEYEEMQRHPTLTANIMRPLKRFKEFAEIAAWHHERWDGNGYPDGLKGEQIPLLARIVAIADTWDAMTGDRVYRKGMTPEKALSIIESEFDSGQWDPELVRVFVAMMRGDLEARHEVEEDMFGESPA